MIIEHVSPTIETWTHPSGPAAPIALVLHGTGSNPDFVRRTFHQATEARGYSLATYRLRGHGPGAVPGPYSFDQHLNDLQELLFGFGDQLHYVGGISLGAHLTATLAARRALPFSVDGLLLAIPAWTGEPEAVAHANAVQADQIAELGTAECLRRLDESLAGSDVHWVYDEMAWTWPEHDEASFEAILRATAASHAPELADLGEISLPTGVAASDDDPLHPRAVGKAWANAIPRAALRTHSMKDFGLDRGILGENAWRALEAASEGSDD